MLWRSEIDMTTPTLNPRHLTGAALITLLFALAACAPFVALKDSASREEVRAAWGGPTLVKPITGGERWIFATAPEGRETWFVDFDASGRMKRQMQVLTEARVAQIQLGQTQAEVEDLIGPSYYTIRYPFRSEELVHIYRYIKPNAPTCFYVHYGPEGKVTNTGSRDDRVGRPSLERPC